MVNNFKLIILNLKGEMKMFVIGYFVGAVVGIIATSYFDYRKVCGKLRINHNGTELELFMTKNLDEICKHNYILLEVDKQHCEFYNSHK
jgi:hypothetical protein